MLFAKYSGLYPVESPCNSQPFCRKNHIDCSSSLISHPASVHIFMSGRSNAIQLTGVLNYLNSTRDPSISCTTSNPYVIDNICLPPVLYRAPSVLHQMFRQPFAHEEQVPAQEGEANDLSRRTWLEAALQSHRLIDRIGEATIESRVTAQGIVNFRLISEEARTSEQHYLLYTADRTDQYREMRLDVDNMTYEELLALEERIGSVTTGLSKETVRQSLKHSRFFTFSERNAQKECCSICQEDHVEDDELGTLTCGHAFHVLCIKGWLSCKNVCPLCKSAGISAPSLP